MLDTQLIRSVMIDWDKIDEGSYLREIAAIRGAEILSFDDGPIHPCTYEETDSYQVTSMFINNREQILHRLLNE